MNARPLNARILNLYSLYTVLTVDQIVRVLGVGRLSAHTALSSLVEAGHLRRNHRTSSPYRPRPYTAYHLIPAAA